MTRLKDASKLLEDLLILAEKGTNDNIEASWAFYDLTRAQYEDLLTCLYRCGGEDAIKWMKLTRYDYLPDRSLFGLRCPTIPEEGMIVAAQDLIERGLQSVPNGSLAIWVHNNVTSVNGELADNQDCLIFDRWRPDLAFFCKGDPDPTVIIEFCNEEKYHAMDAIARTYMHSSPTKSTRTVVAYNVVSGAYTVWRYLRFLPKKVGNHEYRKCFRTQRGESWHDDQAEDGEGLRLTVRDFLPTVLPSFEDMDRDQLVAAAKQPIILENYYLTSIWDMSVARGAKRRQMHDWETESVETESVRSDASSEYTEIETDTEPDEATDDVAMWDTDDEEFREGDPDLYDEANDARDYEDLSQFPWVESEDFDE